MLLFIAGWGSGAGKSTVCRSIISILLKAGHAAADIAYIKPVTQCEAVTDVVDFCKERGVSATGLGSVVFSPGVTNSVIASDDFFVRRRAMLQSVVDSVRELQQKHKFVIVDGVGYPAVGSCCGVGNGDVAAALQCQVLLVAPPGLGDAIDTCEQMLSYFAGKGCNVRGIVFNKCRDTARHKLDAVKPLICKYFLAVHPHLRILGFLPVIDSPPSSSIDDFWDVSTLLGEVFAPSAV